MIAIIIINCPPDPTEKIKMRGNPYARGGDPMKSRAILRKEKRAKLAQTGRVKRLKTRLRGIRDRKDKKEGNHHTTALMESYVTRRKEARLADKKKLAKEEAAAAAASSGTDAAAQQQVSNSDANKRKRDEPAAPQRNTPAVGHGSNARRAAAPAPGGKGKKQQMPISHRAPVSRGLY